MTYLRNIFWRDIFSGSHCHTKIQYADSICCFASMSVPQVGRVHLSSSGPKTVSQKSLRAHGAYVFLTPFAAPAISESQAADEGRVNVQISDDVRVKRRFQLAMSL